MPAPTPVDSKAVHSAGSWLEVETSPGGGTFTPIGETTSINGPQDKMDTLEVTPLLATGRRRQRKASWLDGGEVTVQVNRTYYYDAGQPILKTRHDNRTRTKFRVWWPRDEANTAWDGEEFFAYITALGKTAERDSPQMLELTLQIDGAITPVFQ